MKEIILLGASGNIGSQAREIITDNKSDFVLTGVSVGRNIAELEKIINTFPFVKYVTVEDYKDYIVLKEKYPQITFFYDDQGLIDLIDNCPCSLVINALVGFVGFLPSLHTIEKGIDLALANKESLVVGGKLIKDALKKSKSKLFAIDSEHCALDKCLKNKNREDIKYLVITASGGSFRDYRFEDLKNVTIKDALNHPSWSMGNKITIDSATMMNKGFEVIEAMHLFDFTLDQIKILVHDESIIHSLVEFKDHSYLADIGPTNMKVAISYAMYGNHYHEVDVEPLDFEKLSGLHFRKLDLNFYPCLKLVFEAIRKGGSAPCVLNRSNEEAVRSFLRGEIKFTDIAEIVRMTLLEHKVIVNPNVEDIINSDKWAKNKSREIIRRITNA